MITRICIVIMMLVSSIQAMHAPEFMQKEHDRELLRVVMDKLSELRNRYERNNEQICLSAGLAFDIIAEQYTGEDDLSVAISEDVLRTLCSVGLVSVDYKFFIEYLTVYKQRNTLKE